MKAEKLWQYYLQKNIYHEIQNNAKQTVQQRQEQKIR